MEFCGYGTLSAPVRAQIERVADIWKVHLQAQLVGLYLHGSLALGRFAEGVSDLDLLAVAGRRMPRAERLAVASDMLDADRRPCPLEMSALYIGDLEPWRHPTLCQFHYSDYWAETYRQLLDGRMRGCFLLDEDFPDPDIACHVRLTSESGICILGRPAEEVFPPVPEMDFWDSISRGIEETGPCVSSPRQIVADILNLVRVWSYGSEKRILSKYDAGCGRSRGFPNASGLLWRLRCVRSTPARRCLHILPRCLKRCAGICLDASETARRCDKGEGHYAGLVYRRDDRRPIRMPSANMCIGRNHTAISSAARRMHS